jgi:hypothetical protein
MNITRMGSPFRVLHRPPAWEGSNDAIDLLLNSGASQDVKLARPD